MKTAFLILAHEQPQALHRLIDRLAHPDSCVFVHVDARVNAAPFSESLSPSPNTRFLSPKLRVPIHWSGFSMARATLNLLKEAYASGAERFVLLSGVDYPVRSLSAILEIVGEDRELIAIDRSCNPEGNDWFDKCAFQTYFGDFALLNPRSGNQRLTWLAEKIARRLPRRHYLQAIYYGPSWWSLTRAAVTDVLNFAADQPAMVNWFRYARSPDEMMFQTLLRQSSRAHAIAIDETIHASPSRHPRLAATHYVNFDGTTSGSPRSLDLSDLPDIIASGALFARKMNASCSTDLINEIDRRFHLTE